jgi:hypothetical protein
LEIAIFGDAKYFVAKVQLDLSLMHETRAKFNVAVACDNFVELRLLRCGEANG